MQGYRSRAKILYIKLSRRRNMSCGDGVNRSSVYIISLPGELGQRAKIAKLTKVEGPNPKDPYSDDSFTRLTYSVLDQEQNGSKKTQKKEATNSDRSTKSVGTSTSLYSISQKSDKDWLTREPFQMYCNMVHISCGSSGRISHYCSAIPIFCTVRKLESLLPSTSSVDDIPAYIMSDHRNGIKAIMAENLQPASYLISRSSFAGISRVAVFMPDKCQAADDNMNIVPWHVQQITLSPYLASHTDPFLGSEFMMLGAFSETLPKVDISCLDFEDIVAEIEGSREQACSTYQFGPECSHFYYYLILSKLQSIQMASKTMKKKFNMRINLVDKALQQKKRMAKAKKQKNMKTLVPSAKLNSDKILNGEKK